MRYLTSYGILDATGDRLKLTEKDGTITTCVKHTEVASIAEAERVAKAMHNLEGRFSCYGKFSTRDAD